MKKIIGAFIISAMLFSCNTAPKKEGYTVSGNVKGIHNGIRAYLKTTDAHGRKINKDTAIVLNESFKFEGKVDSPELMYLYINSVNGTVPVFIENDNIKITVYKDSLRKSKVSGSPTNEALYKYSKHFETLNNKNRQLRQKYHQASQTNDTESLNSLRTKLAAISKELTNYPFEFIANNPNNYFSLSLIESLLQSKNLDFEKLINTYNLVDSNIKSSKLGKKIDLKIAALKKEKERLAFLDIGKVAPEFAAPTQNGDLLSLNDIKGKVTIIDFWASWCGPCRRENPNVVKVYNKYHDKGLEIIGVSLDRANQKEKWLKAIKDDKLTWHHVSNLNYFNDPVAKLYNIQSIPATYILDSEGKIVAKNLRGAALEQKIAELLN